jgi:NPCBM/NEW2 domain
VLELLTSPPSELGEHDFRLTVDGMAVPWTNNADRAQLRQWLQRYGRTRARDEDENSRNNDFLAYWWDLSPWRGREVKMQLTLGGSLAKNEIAWRGLSIRSAMMNPPVDSATTQPDVALTSLDPIEGEPAAGRSHPLKDAIPQSDGEQPIRFLGQPFTGGYGVARNSSIQFALKPDYKRFVAVAGCCLQMAGPLRVLIDERVVWERATVSSLAPAETIDVPIPPGAKALTLQFGDGPHYGLAAFARAGFMTR